VDLDIIYKIPLWLHEQGLDHIVLDRLNIKAAPRPICRSGVRWSMPSSIRATRSPSRWSASTSTTRTPTSRSAKRCKHGGLKQRTRVNLRWLESEQVEREGGDACCGRGRHPGARRLRRARLRGQDRAARSYAREQRHSVLRHLLRHACGGGRFARNVAGLGRRQQHRERPPAPTR
jgi:CTP synthase